MKENNKHFDALQGSSGSSLTLVSFNQITPHARFSFGTCNEAVKLTSAALRAPAQHPSMWLKHASAEMQKHGWNVKAFIRIKYQVATA